MIGKKGNKSEAIKLRRKAEELLKKKSSKMTSVSEIHSHELRHELEVHQIELEIQNEELALAKEQADIVAQKYTELYNSAPSGYFTLSKEGEIVELNICGAKMLGKETQQLRGSRFGFFVSDETKAIFNSFLQKVFKSKVEESCEINLLTDGNQLVFVHVNGIITKKGEQCFVSVMNITDRKLADELLIANQELAFQNIEKQKRAEELLNFNKELQQLIQLNSDKDLFISILAHDLRSPFQGLFGISELLSETIHQSDIVETENIVNQLNESLQDTYKLLEDILMWARTQSGIIPFKPKNLNFPDICREVLENFKPTADSKHITINYFSENDLEVFADIDMLKAILRNLVSNAIKFTNINGQIDISAEKNQTNVTITVSDNGIGIEPENLIKLFDISQIQTTTGTEKEKGTGLGLVLCKQFVEKHRGKIWVVSKYGKGTEFKFTLPLFPL
jgi:PAS domain S-box-containing protein